MDRFLKDDGVITAALGKPVRKGKSTVIYSKRGAKVTLCSDSETHGGFDNDANTLNSTLRIVRGSNHGLEEFPG